MLKKSNSYVKKLWILQYFLDFSEPVFARRGTYFCLNSNQFGKVKKISAFIVGNELHKEKELIVACPTRKIFRTYVNELLKEKLITEIKTKDKRSHYYSISPWGICYLLKAKFFRDPLKIVNPNRARVFDLLESFATHYRTYKSEIFENERLDFTNLYRRLTPEIIDGHDLGEEMPVVFTNFEDSEMGGIEFSLDLTYTDSIKIPIVHFRNIETEEITVNELSRRAERFSDYKPLVLNEEQFHHYFANLLICITIYFHAKFSHDDVLEGIKVRTVMAKRERRKPKVKDYIDDLMIYQKYPEGFLRILFLFNRHLVKIAERQIKLMESFTETLHQTQFKA